MKTIEVEVAVMALLDIRKNVVVPNVSWGMWVGGEPLHECDLLRLSKANYATEVEIKVSRADLRKDADKVHRHEHRGIKYLYFAVPAELQDYAMERIPDRAGLYVVGHNGRAKLVREAVARKGCVPWTDKERNKLTQLGCMRILGLKKKIIKLQNH